MNVKHLKHEQLIEEYKSLQEFSKKISDELFKIKNKDEDKLNINIDSLYKFDKKGYSTTFFPKKLGNSLINSMSLINIGGDSLYSYNKGVYREVENIKKVIGKYMRDDDSNIIKSINSTLSYMCIEKYKNPNEINKNENLINFMNGCYDIKNNELISHSRDFYQTIQIKANYLKDFDIKDIIFLKFLKTSGLDDILIDCIQQIIGYFLFSGVDMQKFFIIKGIPKTGKSTFLKIIRGLYSKEFISNVSIQDLQKQEYLAKLIGKSLNICGDIGQNYIDDVSSILQLTGEDELTARPLYHDPIDFKLKTKCLFATNSLPSCNDKTGAFIRRCAIIPFNQVVDEKTKDTRLAEKIIKNEMDIIASWGVQGLKKLIKNNYNLPHSQEMTVELDNYNIENNNLENFIREYCHVTNDKNYYVINIEFNDLYYKFCSSQGMKPLQHKKVVEYLRDTLKLKVDNKSTLKCQKRHTTGICFDESIKHEILGYGNNTYTPPTLKSPTYQEINKDNDKYLAIEREGIQNEHKKSTMNSSQVQIKD